MMMNKVMAILGLIGALAGVIAFVTGAHSLKELFSRPPPSAVVTEASLRTVKCGLDKGAVEHEICADSDLQKKDDTLALLYANALTHLTATGRKQLAHDENDWLRKRTACQNQPNMRQCVSDLFDERIAFLKPLSRLPS